MSPLSGETVVIIVNLKGEEVEGLMGVQLLIFSQPYFFNNGS